MNPTNVYSLAFLGLVMCFSVALGASNKNGFGNNLKAVQSSTLKTCIDDSDCLDVGEGGPFRCFVYICYPWQDDSAVPEKEKRSTCRTDKDCSGNQECYRHKDKRNINIGLCFDEIQDCVTSKDCQKGYGCCSEYCCEDHYFEDYRKLPCSNDLMCQDFGLGDYCCPTDNNSTICCDTDPNPKPTQAPSVGDGGAAGHLEVVKLTLVVSIVSAFFVSKMI